MTITIKANTVADEAPVKKPVIIHLRAEIVVSVENVEAVLHGKFGNTGSVNVLLLLLLLLLLQLRLPLRLVIQQDAPCSAGARGNACCCARNGA